MLICGAFGRSGTVPSGRSRWDVEVGRGRSRRTRFMSKFFYGTDFGGKEMNCESPSFVSRWPVLRVAPGHDCEVRLLSSDWVRLSTHYYGRTVLCSESDACPLCSLLPSRPYWYLPVAVAPRSTSCLLELSPSASSQLEQAAKFEHGSVKAGLMFRLFRKAKKKPIACECLGLSKGSVHVSVAIWVSPLMAIFGLPCLNEGETVEMYGRRVLTMVDERNQLVAARVRSAAEKGPKSR